jgi:hypothetical protein
MTAVPSVADVVARTAGPVLEFSRGWMLSPETAARGAELGLQPGRGFWVVGRCGVLGDVDADVIAAAIGVMHPAMVRSQWESRPTTRPARAVSEAYAECAMDWGRSALAPMDAGRLARLVELCGVVIAAALPSTGAIFAGWRNLRVPEDDPAAAVALQINVLRELRGGAHLIALQAVGLRPLDALLTAEPPRGGPEWADGLGWSGPYDDPAPFMAARAHAEVVTSQLCEHAYAALRPEDRATFVDLVAEARATIG